MELDNDAETLALTPRSINYLKTAKKWALFLAIVGFIGVAFLLLAGIFMGFIFNFAPIPNDFPISSSFISIGISIAYIVMAIIYFFPVWFLYKFSRRVGDAIEIKDKEILAKAFRDLKNCLTSYGILIIIGIIMYGIMVVISIFTALGAAGGIVA